MDLLKGGLSLALAAALTASFFTGCSQKQGPTPDVNGGSGDAAISSENSSSSTGSETDPAPNYPGKKAISLVVCAGAGGGNDTTARLIAKYFPEYLGTVVVTNVKGGSGAVGTQQVMDSVPDGYTLAFTDNNTDMLNVNGITDYSLEVYEEFLIPATADASSLQVSDWDNLEDTVAWAKENPGKLTFGGEVGSYTEMVACAFFSEFGIEGKFIDVGPTSDQLAALAGGHVKMIVAPIGNTTDYRASGQFKTIAMVLKERHPSFPEIPTLIEKGAGEWFYMPRYFYIGFPKGTDKNIIKKFGDALEKIVADERFVADMATVELTPNFMRGDDATAYWQQTRPVWERFAEEVRKYNEKQSA